ncbi:MAG: hypothetical protein GXY22_07905 [Clostridiaceae bacterium]|nr:hypothetical protein [Clostridiaceae bacterium]
MKTNRIIWGLLILVCGVLLLLSALGIDTGPFQWTKVIGSVLLLAIAVSGLIKLRFLLALMPIAGILYLWKLELGFPELNLWLLLAAAFVLGIGLAIIFRKSRDAFVFSHDQPDYVETAETDGSVITIRSSFGEQTKYIHAEQLKKVVINSHFASVKAYFEQVQPSADGLTIDVNAHFSGVILAVPRSWRIENKISSFAAEVSDRDSRIDATGPKVLLRGSTNFAEVKIIRID